MSKIYVLNDSNVNLLVIIFMTIFRKYVYIYENNLNNWLSIYIGAIGSPPARPAPTEIAAP